MRFDNFGGSELNGRDPRGISIANGLNSPASRVVRGLVGWVLFSPRDCGISLGTYLCYFHFFSPSQKSDSARQIFVVGETSRTEWLLLFSAFSR